MTRMTIALVGGPDSIVATERPGAVDGLTEKVKIFVGNGYEHYAHSGEYLTVQGDRIPVFSWCGRTKVAE